jgi:hypothetical protein
MITENQKNEIDNKYLPNGFFYVVKTFDVAKKTKHLNEPFENLELYERAVKHVRHFNALCFFYKLKQLNEIDFIKEINNQYLNYILENKKNAGLWLSLTYDLVLKGFTVSGKIEDVSFRGAFLDWYDTMIIKQPEHTNNNTDAVNIFCKTMPLSIPQEHFKPLTIECSKDGKPFLTQDQFENFIDKGFAGKVHLPKLKFNQAPKGEKFKIQYLFYQFYQNYSFEYFATGQTQDVFIKLLTDNFVGWDFKNVHDNFNTKPKKML